ncbi:hypothetical protein PP7435_CHR4-1147 [Komagataella phaffii CBS 7435]|uniref:Uncharacterized protein n=2 Tax=Komagataella phaffii TaxID=460519 RepID=C4R979_KOMPG|nr:uncharacterized protein PAS_chr4_0884 [Komagataella phaffii GS115]CAH2450373.1 Hypothetical protein BQ9382_C4-0040 [Komagataella phaffii CBS 7435]CAY72154.1 hypothetical protein PAS_chr4_0884 [Komagataella phaffii GS115]SCV12329.1 hypothetical protein PP7435_CHR4-1147 [Komagataella phaffii CBS 7435]
MHSRDWFLAVIGFFLPPLAVFIKRGFLSGDFWINVALCILGYLPGLLHSWYIISCYPYESKSSYRGVTIPGRESQSYGAIQ